MIYNQIVTWTAFAILAMFVFMVELYSVKSDVVKCCAAISEVCARPRLQTNRRQISGIGTGVLGKAEVSYSSAVGI